MADNKPKWCSKCVTEVIMADRVQANREWLECAVCHEPTCTDHGLVYLSGFEHEACHDGTDTTRAEDGQY